VRQIAAVHLTLAHRYVCREPQGSRAPCQAGIIRRPEIIYLIDNHGRWQIIKPGLVWIASEDTDPYDPGESIYYPPGDPTTIARPAAINPPSFACPTSAATIDDPPGDVVPDQYGDPAVDAPWLDIRDLSVASVDQNTLCFTLQLAAPPRPDSSYSINLATEKYPRPHKVIEVQIDGLGDPHVLFEGMGAYRDPGIASSLPTISMSATSLEITVPKPLWPATKPELHVTATSESLQPQEPLIPHPLAGEDEAPDSGCLAYPTGKLLLTQPCIEKGSG
jgi:hypothetical protein